MGNYALYRKRDGLHLLGVYKTRRAAIFIKERVQHSDACYVERTDLPITTDGVEDYLDKIATGLYQAPNDHEQYARNTQ